MAERRAVYLKMQKDASAALEIAQKSYEEVELRKNQLTSELENLKTLATQSTERECAQIIIEAKALAEAIKKETLRIKDSQLNEARAELEQEISVLVKQKVEALLIEKLKDKVTQDKVIKSKMTSLSELNIN